MLFYATTAKYQHLVDDFLAARGRALRGRVKPVAYEGLLARAHAPSGHYLFSDLERLGPRSSERAAKLWDALSASGRGRLFNHPTRVLRRYELLRRLHAAGLNRAGVQRVTDGTSPSRWPVFLRRENDHTGTRSALLHDSGQLRAAAGGHGASGREPRGRHRL